MKNNKKTSPSSLEGDVLICDDYEASCFGGLVNMEISTPIKAPIIAGMIQPMPKS